MCPPRVRHSYTHQQRFDSRFLHCGVSVYSLSSEFMEPSLCFGVVESWVAGFSVSLMGSLVYTLRVINHKGGQSADLLIRHLELSAEEISHSLPTE